MGNSLILAVVLTTPLAQGQGREAEPRTAVRHGLQWLIQQQNLDGSWGAPMSADAVRQTALALAALANADPDLDGGSQAPAVKAATLWLLAQCRGGDLDGLIALRHVKQATPRILANHALAVHALARVYGDIADADRRKALAAVLKRSIQLALNAQLPSGGWPGTLGADSPQEPSTDTTVAVLFALGSCREAGLAVPKEPLVKAAAFLAKCTAADGHVLPALGAEGRSNTRDALALRAAGGFVGLPRDAQRSKWLAACRAGLTLDKLRPRNIDLEAHCWFSQSVWELGSDGWERLFPDDPPASRLTWPNYRAKVFAVLLALQTRPGNWYHPRLAPVEATALALIVLQQDGRPLPLSR